MWRDGKVFNRADLNRSMDFRQAVALTRAAGANLSAYGWHVAPAIHWDEERGAAVLISPGCTVVRWRMWP